MPRAYFFALPLIAMLAGSAVARDGSTVDAATIAVTVEVSDTSLHCNGDSTRVAVHVSNADGTAASDRDVAISAGLASVVTVGRNSSSGTISVRSDRRGDVKARIRPASDGHGRWLLFVGSTGAMPFQSAYACDFSASTDYTLSGELWDDANANGVRDPDEKPLKNVAISIATGYNLGTIVPPHVERTDRRGRFGWTGLFQGPNPVPQRDEWRVCLQPAPDGTERYEVVSFDGVTVAPGGCVKLFLRPGENRISVGARRR